MQEITFVKFAGGLVVPVALGMLAVSVLAGPTAAGGGDDAVEWYRSGGGRRALEKAASLAPSRALSASGASRDPLTDFHERLRPYLSSGGYYSLFGTSEVTRGTAAALPGVPQAAVPRGPNELVNDPTGDVCGFGCTQSEPSIAVSGSEIVIGFNDSRGIFDGTNDISGYSYSIDGGMSWVDGGALPLAGGGDGLSGDPAVVFCNGSFYYSSLYRTPQCSSPATGSVEETEPNDDASTANPVSLGDDVLGNISSSSDVDFAVFSAPAGTLLQATTVLGTLPDSVLGLLDSEGRLLTVAFGFEGSSPAQVVFEIPVSGTYYLVVGSLSGSLGSYTLQIRSCAGSVLPGASAVSVSRGVFIGPVLVWDAPVAAAVATSGADILDKDYVACDPLTGTLYVAYTRFRFTGSGLGQIELVRSTDGGATWDAPTVVAPEDPSLLNQGAMPAVGPSHEVYVAWEQGGMGTSGTGKATLQLRRSDDSGMTFPAKTQVAEFVETVFNPPLGLSRILDFLSIAVDRSGGRHRGNVYVVFEAADRDVRDIKLARSTTGGSSFDPAVRVNDDPAGADQFFPWIAVDPTDGQISVISYDRRLSSTAGFTDVFLTQSNDGGVSFVPGVRVTDTSSSFFVNSDAMPNFGDYINVTADGTAIYATWTDGRDGDPDVFFSSISKDTAPFVLLQGFSLDDAGGNGDGDGVPEPGETPRLKVALRNVGAGAATRVSATLTTNTPGITILQSDSTYGDLTLPGSIAAAQSLYQFGIDPSLECSRTVVCPPIASQIYGVDPGGSIVRFAFDTGSSASVPAPGDQPSGGPDGLAVESSVDAFWVNGFGTDKIIEFNPQTGDHILTGPFPVSSPGAPNCTDGLGLAAPTRLFTQNFCEGKLYEIDTTTGLTVNSLVTPGVIGGLTGGNRRLFATLGFTTIAEVDPDTGTMLNSFPAPDLNGDGAPDSILGLAFDGTYLFAASANAAPPNVAAVDPATGKLVAVSPFKAPSGFLSALDAVAGPAGSVCVAGTFRTVVDLELTIATAQGPFSSALSLPLGREAKTTAFHDDVESGVGGWTALGDWHLTTDRSASSTHSWYFGRENGPGLQDNAYGDSSFGTLTSPPIDLSEARSAELVFDQYLARELCCDFATVSASDDGFVHEKILASLDPALDPAFTEVRLDLSAFAGPPHKQVQIRFSFNSDASVAFEGWYVDNIRVEQATFDCQRDGAGPATTTTTTTTLPPARLCRTDADCTDGKPCTTDRCAGGQCLHAAITGFTGAECQLAQALTCGAESIDARLESVIGMRLEKARAFLEKAAVGRKRANTLIRRAAHQLSAITRAAAKAARKNRITMSCETMIKQRISELRRAISGLRT